MSSFSAFELYSVGIVACVKDLKSRTIMATPREYRFAHQELVHSNPQREDKTVKTNNGERVVNAENNNAIPCEWLAFNTMRKTPPDVRHGDEVLIYTLGDDKYYWVEANSADMKRLETVILAISADPSEALKPDFSNAYFFKFSSHEKVIHLRMNKVTEEVTGYSFEINGKDGYLSAADDLNNAVYINSVDTQVGMENADGTLFQLDKENIHAYAPDSIDVTAEQRIALKCKQFFANCEDWSVTATSSYKVNTPDAVFSDKITTPSAEINGILHENHKHICSKPGDPSKEPMA